MQNIAFPEVIGSYRKAGGRMAELRKKKRKVNSAYAPKMPSGP